MLVGGGGTGIEGMGNMVKWKTARRITDNVVGLIGGCVNGVLVVDYSGIGGIKKESFWWRWFFNDGT